MNERALSVVLTVLMVVSSLSAGGAGLVAASHAGNTAADDGTFHLMQGGECYEIAAMGNGDESVEDFYDYRKPSNSEKYNYTYSSHGTTDLQENQVSNIFVYNGSDGYNVVILHDKLDVHDEDGEYGSTVTFNFSNMDGVTWKVRDDNYSFEDDSGNYHENDDNWSITGSNHSVDWMWADHRTDGGAFTGFGDSEITITPFFNDSAPYWNETAETGNESEMLEWRVLDQNGDKVTSLNMDQEVSIQKGGCPDETSPNADLTASPDTVANDEAVTLDASNSTDDEGIVEYRWDFQNNGEVDRTTEEATVEHVYESTGEYTASVTVVDGNDNVDTATADVTVEGDGAPDTKVTITKPETVNVSEEFELAADATDETKIESYEWDFGSTVETGNTVTHSYAEAGEHSVTLTWTETDGDTFSDTFTITATDAESNITFINASAVEVTADDDNVVLHTQWYNPTGLATERIELENVSGTIVYTPQRDGVNGTAITDAGIDEDGDHHPDHKKNNPFDYEETIKPEPVTVSVESVTESSEGTYEVTFAYENPNDDWLLMDDSQYTTGNVSGEPPERFYPGENTTTVTWTPDSDDERVTWTVNRSNFDQSEVSASTQPASEYGDDDSGSNVTFVNATAVEIEGSYDTVRLNVDFYDETGYGNAKPGASNVSGTTLIEVEDHGVNGSFITTVELFEDGLDDKVEERQHPRFDYYAETIKPEPVTVSVEDVTETGNDTYEVTFAYENPNDESLDMRDSTLSGNVSGEAPRVVEPGTDTFTVTWTPDDDMERATWTLDRANFGQDEVSANTKPAGEYDEDDSGATEADVTASPTEGYGETEFTFDASGSTGDEGIEEYRWDFDGDGKVDRTTDDPVTTRTYSEPGDHPVSVQVVGANGTTDVASTTVMVLKVSEDEPPTARLTVPDGSMSQLLYPFDASDSTDDDEIVKYRWDFDSDGEVEWTEHEDGISSIKPYTIFDEPGTYKATVTVVDSAGQTDSATAKFTVEKVPPTATIDVSTDSIEVGEEVTFTAKNFNEAPGTLKHICWKVGDEPGPDGKTWTTSFEESGEKTIKLVLRDRAGHQNTVTKTITIEAADDGGSDDKGDDNKGGYEDDPNEGKTGGSLPPADGSNGDDGKDDEAVKAPLNGEHAEMGEIALLPAADADATLEVSETAPADVEAPSVADDGFEALSYATVADAEQATFTVSKDRLDAAGATADDVTLFRYEDGAWTAVETELVGETDDAYEFEADAADGTYAVGVDRAATSVTDLTVESQRVEPGETVEVVATVENDGRADGTHEVQLTVGGDVVATESVEVVAGDTATVSFAHTFEDSGVFDVSVDDERAEVVVEGIETRTSTTDDSGSVETSVSTTTNDGAGVPGFGVGVTLVALLGAALLALRRR